MRRHGLTRSASWIFNIAIIDGTIIKVDMVLFVHDTYDVMCWLLTSIGNSDPLPLSFPSPFSSASNPNPIEVGTLFPFPILFPLLLFHSLVFSPFHLEVCPWNPARLSMGSAVSSPSGVSSRNRVRCILASNMPFGGSYTVGLQCAVKKYW